MTFLCNFLTAKIYVSGSQGLKLSAPKERNILYSNTSVTKIPAIASRSFISSDVELENVEFEKKERCSSNSPIKRERVLIYRIDDSVVMCSSRGCQFISFHRDDSSRKRKKDINIPRASQGSVLNKFQAVLPYSRESVCAFVRIIYSTPVASVPFSCLSAAAFLSSPPFLTFRFLFRLPPGNISRQIASVVILGLPDNTTETLFLRFVYHFPSVEMILLAATSVFYFYFEGASRPFQSDCTNSRCENTWKYYCKFKNNWSTRLFYFHSIDLLIYFRLSYFKE